MDIRNVDIETYVDQCFEKMGIPKHSLLSNGVNAYFLTSELPINGLSCPVNANSLVFIIPYDRSNGQHKVIIYGSGNKKINEQILLIPKNIDDFLHKYFRPTFAIEELIRINEKLDYFLDIALKLIKK